MTSGEQEGMGCEPDSHLSMGDAMSASGLIDASGGLSAEACGAEGWHSASAWRLQTGGGVMRGGLEDLSWGVEAEGLCQSSSAK